MCVEEGVTTGVCCEGGWVGVVGLGREERRGLREDGQEGFTGLVCAGSAVVVTLTPRTPDGDGAEVVEDGVPHRGEEVRHLIVRSSVWLVGC